MPGGRPLVIPDNPTGLLRCPVCKIDGHLGVEFTRGVRQGHPCKPCSNERQRAWRRKSPRWKEYAAERIAINRALVDDYKLARGCADCGYAESSVALDFHHVDPKTKKYCVGALTRTGTAIDTLIAEIEKCIVICANCHRIRTWKR